MSRRNLTAFEEMLGADEENSKDGDAESPTTEEVEALRDRLGDMEKTLQDLVRAGRPRPINDQ